MCDVSCNNIVSKNLPAGKLSTPTPTTALTILNISLCIVAVPPPSPPRISFVIDEEGGVKDDDVSTFCLLLINARCFPLARLRSTDDAIEDEVDLLPSTDMMDRRRSAIVGLTIVLLVHKQNNIYERGHLM